MGKFERYCSIHCRNRATRMDVNAQGIKFRWFILLNLYGEL
jgi:hypothetical protein